MQKDLKRTRKRTLSKKKIVQLYGKGKRTSEIAKLANVSSRYVLMILKEFGVEMRPHGSWKRKYKVNEDYFREWSNNMAYVLGFLCADGMIAQNAQLISFSQKEKYILKNIRNELDSTHSIIQNKKTGVYILNVHSKIIKDDLITIHGITPNKSRNLQFPKVPDEYLSHFVRGYFDGDGFVKYEKYFVSFVGGSEYFMTNLRNKIENAGFITNFTTHSNCYRVYVSGRKTIKLFSNWMYKDKGLFLKRKYNEFQKEKLPANKLKDRAIKVHQNAIQARENRRKAQIEKDKKK